MTRRNQWIPGVFALVGAALVLTFVTAQSALPPPDSLFRSWLPTAKPTESLNSVWSAKGGRIYCGSTQSSSWLEIPVGFTSDWGAEIHCSAAVPLKGWGKQTGMWDKQGFLIGVYPATVPILKPMKWVQEIDPVRMKGVCSQCLVGRYYQPDKKIWVDLPTTYQAALGRVTVEIGGKRPPSGYPGYADRVLVALFQLSRPPTATPRAGRPALATATPTPLALRTQTTATR